MLAKLKVKYIQTLGQKKFRNEEGLFIAEGPKLVNELLQEQNVSIRELFATQEWVDEFNVHAKNSNLTIVTGEQLQRLSQLSTPNDVIAIVEQFGYTALPAKKDRITVVLDNVQDPGNLGTIIRLADWFGLQQVVCSEHCADLYNPKVVQATMGSIAHVPVSYTDLVEWLNNQADIPVYAAALNGEPVNKLKKTSGGIVIIGNESKGIGSELLQLAHSKITIPGKGRAESLNAAVAAGIILSHLCL